MPMVVHILTKINYIHKYWEIFKRIWSWPYNEELQISDLSQKKEEENPPSSKEKNSQNRIDDLFEQ
jgi:hypothetical protein